MSTYEQYLQECKWRDISFPLIHISTNFSQELVQHKYPDRDGAHVESTGRNPLVVSAKAVFYNTASRGKNESWAFGNLFPTVFNQFVSACKDKSPGKLQHPLHGTFDAKVQSFSYDIDPNRRDGVIVDVSWIETIKNELAISVPTVEIEADAKALDDALSRLPSSVYIFVPEASKPDLFDSIEEIKGVIDGAALSGQKALGQIDRVSAKISRVSDSVRRLNDVTYSNVVSKAENLKASLITLKKNLGLPAGIAEPLKSDASHLVTQDTTMAALVSLLETDIGTLLRMNRKVASKPIIPAGTVIRYRRLA